MKPLVNFRRERFLAEGLVIFLEFCWMFVKPVVSIAQKLMRYLWEDVIWPLVAPVVTRVLFVLIMSGIWIVVWRWLLLPYYRF